MIRYVIWAPPYDERSGGVRAQYTLCQMLRARGQYAVMRLDGKDRQWIESPFDAPNSPRPGRNELVIYPECVPTNAADADRYVHWLLGPRFDIDGELWGWLPTFGVPVLHVPIVDTGMFYPRTGRRAGTAFWVGKGQRPDRVPDSWMEIDRGWPHCRADLAEYLGRLRRFVSYDGFTALTLEAILCGTPVQLISDHRWTRTFLDTPYSPQLGVAFPGESWSVAADTVAGAFDAYVEAQVLMGESVDRFIEATA